MSVNYKSLCKGGRQLGFCTSSWSLSPHVQRTCPHCEALCAGLFGIGGGMIMGPLLLEFGLHPMVSAATSGLMVLFSSSIAAFSFGFDHLLNTQFALVRHCQKSEVVLLGRALLFYASSSCMFITLRWSAPTQLSILKAHGLSPSPAFSRASPLVFFLPPAPGLGRTATVALVLAIQQKYLDMRLCCSVCAHKLSACKHMPCDSKIQSLASHLQIFGLGCFGASLLGVLLVARVVKRSGKASIVVFLLAMVIGVGAILTAIFGGRDAILVRSMMLRVCRPLHVPGLCG